MISIDSTKLRIPTYKIEITDPSLLGKVKVYKTIEDTGELISEEEEFKREASIYSEDGITIRAIVEKIVTPHHSEEYLTLLLNSKALRTNYLDGIRSYHIEDLCSFLNSKGIAVFTPELLLEGTLYDTDYKEDYKASEESFKLFLEELKEAFIDSGNKFQTGLDYSIRKSNKTCMLQANMRTTKHYQSRPFIKFYDKEKELNFHQKTIPFTQAYLKDQDFKDLKRTEFTIKNIKHAKALGMPYTLKEVFATPQSKLQQVKREFMSKNFHNPRNIEAPGPEGLSAQEQRFLNHLRFFIDKEETPFHFVNNALRGLTSSTAHRDKELYERLYKMLIDQKESPELDKQFKEYKEAQSLLDSHFGEFE